MGETKKCKTCGEEKELSEFYFDAYKLVSGERKKYRRGSCKSCEKGRKTRSRHWTEYRRKAYESGIKGERYLKLMANGVRARSKKKGLACEISWEDIVIPETCPVLGIKICLGNGRDRNNSPSIDRLDNSIGYTKENIRIISWRANHLKGNASFEELEALYNWMKKELGKE